MADRAEAAGTFALGGDLQVCRMGFGAMRITGKGVWGEPPDVMESKAVLRRAVELGVNFIDTADSYGPEISEQLIAEALTPYPEDLVIATKGGKERTGPNEWPLNGRPSHLKAACEGSLRRLGVERIDLYQWHSPDPAVPLEDSVGALVELKEEGKIRHIGVSNVTQGELEVIQRITPVVSVQNRYNICDRKSDSIVDFCDREGLAFLPWAPIHDVAESAIVDGIALNHSVSRHQVVLAWLFERSSRMVVIPGTSSLSHLQENVAAASLQLHEDELAQLSGLQAVE